MGKFQKLIARLFNIQADDLQPRSKSPKQTEQVDSYTKDEITQLVQEQVSQAIKGINWTEKQKAVGQQVSGTDEEIQEERLNQRPAAQEIELPLEQNQDISSELVDLSILTVTEPLDNDFPVLEDIVSIDLDARGVESPVDECRQVDDTVFPPVQETLLNQEKESASFSKLTPEPMKLFPIEGQQIRLGIDFGTTTTAISFKFNEDLPLALPIGKYGVTHYIPSVVYFAPGTGDLEQRATVGEEAENLNDPLRTIRSVKRCFACKGNECEVDHRQSYCCGDGYIHIEAEKPIEPAQVARLIVEEALRRAIECIRDRWLIDLTRQNVTFYPVNFGCGAKFDLDRRNLLCRILMEMGFTNFSILNVVEEPILAGFAFTRFSENPIGRSLIYDFGGGTFDAAIIEVDEVNQDRRVTILATSADNWLGGDDIDTLVYQYFLTQISSASGRSEQDIEFSLNVNDAGKMRLLAKQAKEFLSDHWAYEVTLPSSSLGLVDLHLDRYTFESILQKSNLVSKSLEVVLHACKLVSVYDKACLTDVVNSQEIIELTLPEASSMIDHIVLVGGVTKIPFVRESLVNLFSEHKIIEETVIEPVTAVAIGGAYAHDPNHYSMVVPPFGYFLKYPNKMETVKKYLLKPFEFYDFNRLWATATVGSFKRTENVLVDRPNAELHMERAGYEETTLLRSWNPLAMGNWVLTLSLDGSIGFQSEGQIVNNLAPNHQRHPRQQAIVDARRAREQAMQLAANQNFDFDDDLLHFAID